MWKSVAAVIGILALSGCGGNASPEVTSEAIATGQCPAAEGAPSIVSLLALTQSPSTHHGRLVRLSGIYRSGFELSAVVPVAAASQELDPKAGIWVSPLPDSWNGRRVELVGYFTHAVKGHGGQWPGSLCIVSSSLARQDAP